MPLARTKITNKQVDSDNEFSGNVSNKSKNQEVLVRSILRLRGGEGSDEGSPIKQGKNTTNSGNSSDNMDTNISDAQENLIEMDQIPNEQNSPGTNLTQLPGTSKTQLEKSMSKRLISIKVGDIQTDSELSDNIEDMNTRKRFKHRELNARNDTHPGLNQSTTLGHAQTLQRLTTRFDVLILSEAFSKKTSRTHVKELMEIREKYNEIFEQMILENSMLEGRLLEARAERESKTRKVTINEGKLYESDKGSIENREIDIDQDKRMTNNKERNTRLRFKRVSKDRSVSETSNKEATESETDAQTSDGKGRASDADVSTAQSGNDDVYRQTRRKTIRKKNARKQKIKELKAIDPQKQFLWEIDDERNADTVKKEIWAEIVKKVKVPKIEQTKLANKGDKTAVRIVTTDMETYKALKDLENDRENVRKVQSKKPMIQIYDVDRNLSEEEIKDLIKSQNPDVFDINENVGITPIFKRGPRDGPTVW